MRFRKSGNRRRQPQRRRPFFDKNPTNEAFFPQSTLQRKTEISQPGDPQEAEAESAARQVVSQPVQKAEKKDEYPAQRAEKKDEEKPVQKEAKKEEEKPVQKEAKKEEEKPVQKEAKKEEEKPVHKAEMKDEKEKPVQKMEEPPQEKKELPGEAPVQRMAKQQPADPANAPDTVQLFAEAEGSRPPDLERRLAQQKGRGEPLSDDIRDEMETKFHTRFGQVRIHTDREAVSLCEELHALAFTHGYDIYFNEGKYNPNSDTGKELLAHELAHVVQQCG